MSALPAVTLRELRIGRARAFGPNGEPSAIDKRLATAPLWLGPQGLEGDEQGDPRHHGGPEKAVHHYAAEHYAAWRQELPPASATHLQPGAFGENFSTLGLTEANICVGDIFRLGGATLQVSQARQPCWKLNVRFGIAEMALRVQRSGRTGWYYRVLEAGEISPGGALTLIDRPCPTWTLARMLHYLFIEPLDRSALDGLANLAPLSPSWRALATGRLTSGRVESWFCRLATPATRR